MLRFLHKYLPRQTLNELYKLYVVRILIMVMSIYHIPQKVGEFRHEITLHRQMERLESVQYSARLAITETWKGSSREKKYTRNSDRNSDGNHWITEGGVGASFFFLSSSINFHLNIQDNLFHKFVALTTLLKEELPLGE